MIITETITTKLLLKKYKRLKLLKGHNVFRFILLALVVACTYISGCSVYEKKSSIQGFVNKIEFPENKRDVTNSFEQPYRTKLFFKDGRIIEFNNLPYRPIEINKYYMIIFNKQNEIITIQEFVNSYP